MTVHGAPPWDTAPTPPLAVFREALAMDQVYVDQLKAGHLRPLLQEALEELDRWQAAADSLAARVAELEEVAAVDAERRRVKREYQADFRAGLRGNRAARAALRKGAES